MNRHPSSTPLLGMLALLSACAADPPVAPSISPNVGGIEALDSDKRAKGNVIMDIVDEPPGARCPTGGKALRRARDKDGDGNVDMGEVFAIDYVCNGNDGRTPVIASKPEPIGVACPTGGHAISWGYDDNANGHLDAHEVAQTTYVCNGLNGLDGKAGANGTNGQTSLVTVIPQPAGLHCAAGGQGIYSGVDLDGDGLLQPGEVKTTAFVCNGVSGFSALVRTDDEAPGASCVSGGLRVLSGVDTDGDGTLADAEVTKTSHVCHGAPGAPGPKGDPGLAAVATKVRVTPEPAGASCAQGGQRIDVGPDTNVNGLLDASEIAQTRYVCNGAPGGVGGAVPLLTIQRPAAVGECPQGGTVTDIGFDASGDGVIQGAERSAYVALCTLARHGSSPCPAHSFSLETGIDRNLDGALGNEEVIAQSCVGFRQVAAGEQHQCALTHEGRLFCWGHAGAVGSPAYQFGGLPVSPVGLDQDVSAVAASLDRTCAVRKGGDVYCWGAGVATPTLVAGIASAAAAVPGSTHACALRTDGTVWCWGSGSYGEIGDGAYESRPSPVAVAGLVGATSLAVSGRHACVALADGAVKCWGSNVDNEVGGVGTPSTAPSPVLVGVGPAASVSVGPKHSCALLEDATVACWGSNAERQVWDFAGAPTTVSTPVTFVTAAVSLGASFTSTCWTLSYHPFVSCHGTLDAYVPPTGFQPGALSVGLGHGCMIDRFDGSLRCWGTGPVVQFGGDTQVGVRLYVEVLPAF